MIWQTSSAVARSGWNKRTETSGRCFAIGCNYTGRSSPAQHSTQDLTFLFFCFFLFFWHTLPIAGGGWRSVSWRAWKRIRDSRRRKVWWTSQSSELAIYLTIHAGVCVCMCVCRNIIRHAGFVRLTAVREEGEKNPQGKMIRWRRMYLKKDPGPKVHKY